MALALTLFGMGGCGLAAVQVSASGGILVARWRLLAMLGIWTAAFALAAWSLFAVPRRIAIGLLVSGTLALTVFAVLGRPQLSDDLYRYAWDGKVQASGVDPYRYPPTDPHLERLRDPWLWPDAAACAELQRLAGCTRLNRPDARTIYPPVAQLYFRAGQAGGLSSWRERGWQLPAAVAHLGLTALLLAALRRLGRDPRLAVCYAWCPLAVVESGMDAHVDVWAAGLAVGAVWAMERRRGASAGVLLGIGTAVKLLPALLLPVALRRASAAPAVPGAGRRRVVVLASFAAVLAAGYLPHVLAVGPAVLGYLPGYLREENYGSGSRFLLLGLVGATGPMAQAFAVAAIVAAATWTLRRRTASPSRLAVELVGMAFLVTTPVQPWYAVLLVALAALAGRWEWLAIALAAYPLYFAAVLDADATLIGRFAYGAAALVVITATAIRWSRRPRERVAAVAGPPGIPDPAATRS